MIDIKHVFDALAANAPASAPEIARSLMGGAAKTTKSDIAKTRETLKWLVADGLATLSETDSKRGRLFFVATTKADVSASDDVGDKLADGIEEAVNEYVAINGVEKNDAETVQGVLTSGCYFDHIGGAIMNHAVHLTGQILAADPKTDKIWAADRALDAVRHIARRIEKEGAK